MKRRTFKQLLKDNIDLILLIIMSINYALSLYLIWEVRSIPENWRIALMAIFTLLYLIFLALSFKRLANKSLWIRRVFVVLLTILYGCSSLYTYKAVNSMKQMTNTEKDKFITISVVVNSDSELNSLDDLNDKRIGVQNGMDEINALYGKSELDKEVSVAEYLEENSYLDLATMLANDEIDAMIITSSFIKNIDAEKKGFEESIKTIGSFKRKIETTESSTSTKDLTKEPFTLLISGIDTTDDGEASLRSDVNMILIVNPLTNHVEMVSLPRDTYIPNIALGSYDDKLTHTSNNGVENTVDSLDAVIGFDIDFYVQLNFTSVLNIVDTIGGIEVDVPVAFSEQNSERSFAPEDLITLEAGVQTLNGEEALALARHRKSYGDVERTRSQQRVVKGIINKLLSVEGATKVPALLDILPKYINTNVSYGQLSDFINFELKDLDPWTFGSTSLDNGDFDSLPTASMGAQLLSCYVLSLDDMNILYKKYQMIIDPTTFNEFTFNLDDLGAELDDYTNPGNVKFIDDDSYIPEDTNDDPYGEYNY